jgi:hypothetical protein
MYTLKHLQKKMPARAPRQAMRGKRHLFPSFLINFNFNFICILHIFSPSGIHARTPEGRIEQGVGTAEAASAAAVCADVGVCVSAAAAAAAAASVRGSMRSAMAWTHAATAATAAHTPACRNCCNCCTHACRRVCSSCSSCGKRLYHMKHATALPYKCHSPT